MAAGRAPSWSRTSSPALRQRSLLPDRCGRKVVLHRRRRHHGQELWKSDGTRAGTVLVKDIHPCAGQYGRPSSLTACGETLFFAADDGTHGGELWKSNGTKAGTVLVKDINGRAPLAATRASLTAVAMSRRRRCAKKKAVQARVARAKVLRRRARGSRGDTGSHGRDGRCGHAWRAWGRPRGYRDPQRNGLRRSRKRQAAPLLRWRGAPSRPRPSSEPANFADVGGTLFFTADDGIHGRELWKSDGTEAGTVLVKDIDPGTTPTTAHPSSLTAVGGTLFFTADDGIHGRELWKSDGTEAGTVLVKDIDPGTERRLRRRPVLLTAVGGTLFFTADDGTHGRSCGSRTAPRPAPSWSRTSTPARLRRLHCPP